MVVWLVVCPIAETNAKSVMLLTHRGCMSAITAAGLAAMASRTSAIHCPPFDRCLVWNELLDTRIRNVRYWG